MNWMKFKWLYFLLSAVVIIPGLFSLLRFGLRPAIDFTGGTLLEIRYPVDSPPPSAETIQSELANAGYEIYSVQPSGSENFIIRTRSIEKEQALAIENLLSEKTASPVEEIRFESVGPVLGRELLNKTVIAIILASLVILSYIAWRFKNAHFGICAVLAMFHDSLVLLGVFSLLGHFASVEVDSLFVTAMLTILSFSVHDTVVVYDRIRESQHHQPKTPFANLVNQAVTETLSRSLNNSLTIIFMLIALYLLGGETTKWFVFALLVGTIAGTYSSTFTAAPLLVVWHNLTHRRQKKI